jgi:hypothetical protein
VLVGGAVILLLVVFPQRLDLPHVTSNVQFGMTWNLDNDDVPHSLDSIFLTPYMLY